MSVQKTLKTVNSIGKVLAAVLVIFATVSYMVSVALGPILFFSTSDGLSVAAKHISVLPIDFFMILTLPIPVGSSLGIIFAGVWVAFVVCFVFAWLSRGGFIKSVREALSKPFTIARTNFLFMMPLIAAGLLYTTVLIEQFQAAQGVQTGSLNFPPQTSQYLILLELAFAPLREEFAFRITSIGIPLGIFLLIKYHSDPKISGVASRIKLILLAMASPELAKQKVGFKNVSANGFPRGISWLEWVFILVTAVSFGSAHYLLGGGWEIGKVTTAFLAGLTFGVAYVAYGAYAPILLHWFFNYYFTVLDLAHTTYGGVYSTFANLTEVVTLGAGFFVLVVFLVMAAVKVADYLSLRVAQGGKSG